MDRHHFDSLFPNLAFTHLCQIFVYHKWACLCFNDFQESLNEALALRFSEDIRDRAQYWTLSLTAQIVRDVGLVPYLVAHGIHQQCGTPIRRCLENIGVLSHFWCAPSKAALLGDSEDDGFRKAFVWEPDPQRREELRKTGISKRFAVLSEASRMPATRLYALVSDFCIHGGTPKNLLRAALEPTSASCTFVNRVEPADDDAKRLSVYEGGIALTLTEFALLVGTYGMKSRQVREGGAYLTQLITNPDSPSSRMSQDIELIRRELTDQGERRD